eukprot:jgi/Chrzof1/12973/Cz07g14160.t1
MAFSFGSSASPFTASSTPAFGAATPASSPFNFAPAAASTPVAAPLFGGSSTPAFGGFGASTPAFGAPSSSPFGFSAPAASPFGAPAAAPAFGSSTGGFTFATAGALVPAQPSPFSSLIQSGPSTVSAPTGPIAQQPPAGPPQSQGIHYNTKFEELPPDIQKQLFQIQQEITKYENDRIAVSQQLQQRDASGLRKDIEAETSGLKSQLKDVQLNIRLEQEALADFRVKAVRLLKSTESVVRTFQRSKLWREAPQQYKGQILPPALQELLSMPVVLPSPFLEEAVAGFQAKVQEYRTCLSELEQVLASHGSHDTPDINLVQTLPTILSSMHDYFIHVAAKLERVHNEVEKAKAAYLAQLRQQGIYSDPFERARRQEHMQQSQQQKPVVIPLSLPGQQGGATAGDAKAGSNAVVQASTAPAGFGAGATASTFGGGTGSSPFIGAGFGSPFVGTPGAFGAAATPANGSLSRTASKAGRSSKKR